jgi:fatty acid desaturase
MVTLSLAALPELNSYSHRDKPLWNALALVYVIVGYGLGIVLLLVAPLWLNLVGVLLLAHTLSLSTVLTHEFMHGTIFPQQRWNEWGGNLMLWLNGGCYARFRDLTRWHIAHHQERADFAAVDLPVFLQQLPQWMLKLILALEWLYFPAVAFLMQWRMVTGPYWHPKRSGERTRATIILLTRGALFALLAAISLKALCLYLVAYIGMHWIMQLMNAFVHTYARFDANMQDTERTWHYEQSNTFSCLISQHWLLNLLILNFGYHNAHHAVMRCPWHSLHELDRELFADCTAASNYHFTIWQVLGNYHRYRLTRILSGHGTVVDQNGNYSLENFYGDVGLGFMILPV